MNAIMNTPESIAEQAFDAVEAGRAKVLGDERTRHAKAALGRPPGTTAPTGTTASARHP
ncbi:hypothetical protein [Streptomyces natalensis]|uniref:hypothetical protein n=1 Tax=Streptomyces natalensis TaxID=68242 RepID=UPI000B0AAE08|nr:hypothetical protein [Streptomyces natalensis]